MLLIRQLHRSTRRLADLQSLGPKSDRFLSILYANRRLIGE
jgi:hypothetical protein